MSARAVATAALCLGGLWACAGGEEDDREETEVLVIEDPVTFVLSGSDTTRVYVPTVFSYVDPSLLEEASSPAEANRILEFREGLQQALEALGPQGVRFVHVEEPPAVVGAPGPPGAEMAALPTGSIGYLLVHPSGRARWIEGTLEAAALVCAAASVLELAVQGC